jgi:hypothetical protein
VTVWQIVLGFYPLGFFKSRRSKDDNLPHFLFRQLGGLPKARASPLWTGKQARVERPKSALHGAAYRGMRSGSTMGDFNFAVGGGIPFNVNWDPFARHIGDH